MNQILLDTLIKDKALLLIGLIHSEINHKNSCIIIIFFKCVNIILISITNILISLENSYTLLQWNTIIYRITKTLYDSVSGRNKLIYVMRNICDIYA